MSDDVIKPCPFCGSDKIQIARRRGELGAHIMYLYCVDCHASGPEKELGNDRIVMVNTRACVKHTGWNNRS